MSWAYRWDNHKFNIGDVVKVRTCPWGDYIGKTGIVIGLDKEEECYHLDFCNKNTGVSGECNCISCVYQRNPNFNDCSYEERERLHPLYSNFYSEWQLDLVKRKE